MAESSTAPPLSELRPPGESESDLQILLDLDARATAIGHADPFSPAAAAALVRHDLTLFKQIESEGIRDRAMVTIAEIAVYVPLYRAELARRDPALLAEAEVAAFGEQARISAKEDRKANDLKEVGDWERMPSVGDAEMRSNGRNGFVEVQQDGAVVALADLAAINDWVENHDASVADKERLVSLGIKAHKAFNEPH